MLDSLHLCVLGGAASLQPKQAGWACKACACIPHYLQGLPLTLGPNTTPPPLSNGELLEPCLAFPVPFCLYGFLPPPRTSALVLVLADPCMQQGERSAWYACSMLDTQALPTQHPSASAAPT